MEDSEGPAEESDIERLYEFIKRRKLVVGLLGFGGGWFLTSLSDSEDHVKQAENRLVQLAATIDNTNLADPRQGVGLPDTVRATVESASQELNRDLPDNPETEQRVSTLRDALEYYAGLADTLETTRNLISQAAVSESKVLNHKRELKYDLESRFDAAAFEEAISQLSTVNEGTDSVTPQGRTLVPDQQRVIDALSEQREIYTQHFDAQQAYLDSSVAIEAGIRAHEESNWESAQSTLKEAHDTLVSGISEDNRPYRLYDSGLALKQYETLFGLRRDGVSKLRKVSDASVSSQRRQSVTNDAIDLFFEARTIVIRSNAVF